MTIGAAGTHPFARWQEQEIVDRKRYAEVVAELGYIARQELIFGMHVHVAIEGADRAIYVADGIRRYLPLLLALSANSPFWAGQRTGLMSTRTPVFRAFPRVGIPPHYGTWEIYSGRVEKMMESGAIEDYSFLWWDVRAHPNLGTVETRVFDQPTRIEDTGTLVALTAALAHSMVRLFDAGEPLVEQPGELIDDNKVRAAVRGMAGELVDFYHGTHVPAPALARRLLGVIDEDAVELGCGALLEGVDELAGTGTGALWQLETAERYGGDLRALVREIVARTRSV
jgi:carboxylate-amine ligase